MTAPSMCPGCNMAFWRLVLSETGGFDPVYTKAWDDEDVCWKVLNRDWEIGFHPAALVWHRRRVGLRNYLRQQREYGRSGGAGRGTGTRSASRRPGPPAGGDVSTTP